MEFPDWVQVKVKNSVEKLLTMFGTMDSGINISCLTFPLK